MQRIYSSRLDVGSRLPAYCTSLGQVLLGGLDDRQLEQWLGQNRLVSRTPHTITDPEKLRAKVQKIRKLHYAMIDGELEIGARSIAVPILDRSSRTVAALNIFASTTRVSLEKMRKVFLPVLRDAAQEIARNIEGR
jgi:IclR family pca regulon transcriptional regulator